MEIKIKVTPINEVVFPVNRENNDWLFRITKKNHKSMWSELSAFIIKFEYQDRKTES